MKRIFPLYKNKRYGPDHHIWNNNGSWWAHFSVTRKRGRCKRVRVSLCTKDRLEARERRDQLLASTPKKARALVEKWRGH